MCRRLMIISLHLGLLTLSPGVLDAVMEVRDEFSKFGTYVNGNRIPSGFSVLLRAGDEIEFGSSENRFTVQAG